MNGLGAGLSFFEPEDKDASALMQKLVAAITVQVGPGAEATAAALRKAEAQADQIAAGFPDTEPVAQTLATFKEHLRRLVEHAA